MGRFRILYARVALPLFGLPRDLRQRHEEDAATSASGGETR